jgi:hypothetical protein
MAPTAPEPAQPAAPSIAFPQMPQEPVGQGQGESASDHTPTSSAPPFLTQGAGPAFPAQDSGTAYPESDFGTAYPPSAPTPQPVSSFDAVPPQSPAAPQSPAPPLTRPAPQPMPPGRSVPASESYSGVAIPSFQGRIPVPDQMPAEPQRPAAPRMSFDPVLQTPATSGAPSGYDVAFQGQSLPVGQPAAPPPGSPDAQSYRIRLRMPDGKPFDGPEITTGPATPWDEETPAASGLTMVPAPPQMSAPWGNDGPRKTAPKVVVKAGPGAKVGHMLAVLAISALGIVPLAYLMLNAIHAHEDKVAETVTVPTKVNVIDGSSGVYLGGMAAVLLVVVIGYRLFLRRRRG